MSLRDYFAAKAMQAAISTLTGEPTETAPVHCAPIARDAYEMADAMLKAREQSGVEMNMVDLSKIADALAEGKLLICKEHSGMEIPPDSLTAVIAALRVRPEAGEIAGLRLALAKAADTMRDAERVFRLFGKDTAAEAMRIAAEHSRDVLCGREQSIPQE